MILRGYINILNVWGQRKINQFWVSSFRALIHFVAVDRYFLGVVRIFLILVEMGFIARIFLADARSRSRVRIGVTTFPAI